MRAPIGRGSVAIERAPRMMPSRRYLRIVRHHRDDIGSIAANEFSKEATFRVHWSVQCLVIGYSSEGDDRCDSLHDGFLKSDCVLRSHNRTKSGRSRGALRAETKARP